MKVSETDPKTGCMDCVLHCTDWLGSCMHPDGAQIEVDDTLPEKCPLRQGPLLVRLPEKKP